MLHNKELTAEDLLNYEFIKRLDGITVRDMHGYIPYWGKNIVDEKFNNYMKEGLIKICCGYEVLYYMKIPFLKDILKNNKLKVSGKKQELIDRIILNIKQEDLIIPEEYDSLIKRTQKGQEMYNYLLSLKENERITLIDGMVEALKKHDFDMANRLMCTYEIKQPFQRGLFISMGSNERQVNEYGIDITHWKCQLKTGFSEKEIKVYSEMLNKVSWNILAILNLCLSVMLGMSYYNTEIEIERYFIRHGLELQQEKAARYKDFIQKYF